MARFLKTEEAAAALRSLLDESARFAADENVLIARDEEVALDPFLQRYATLLRGEGGSGTRIYVDALVERAYIEAMATWDRHSPPDSARDARYLALEEISAIEREDPALGALTRAARDRVLIGVSFGDAVRAWFDAFDFEASDFAAESLPGGERVDAREGQPGREGLSDAVLAAFDFYYRVEHGDWGSVSLHRGTIGSHALWAIYTSTDGDEAYLEILDEAGAVVDGLRFWGTDRLWDDFPGRVRLAPMWTRFEGYDHEEGSSEADERAAAGQPPRDWAGELHIDQGSISYEGRLMGAVDFGELTPTDEQRALAIAALEHLWDVHLRHTVWGGNPLELGPSRQGTLTIGPFDRVTDGKTYLTADWRDIDDGSFVLYYEQGPYNPLLRIQQFDN